MLLTRAPTVTIYDFISPTLIILTPFISLINYNDYSYTAPEFWICVAGLLAIGLLFGTTVALGGTWWRVFGTAGLLTLFVDIQFDWFDNLSHLWLPAAVMGMSLLCWLIREHLSRITTAVFATMLVTSLLFQGGSNDRTLQSEARPADQMRSSAPPIVHLIFDEFIGIEGIPPEAAGGNAVRHSLRSFLLGNGFRVFGRAYSRFHRTINAIPNTLNYSSSTDASSFIEKVDKFRILLRQNQYFKDMYKKRYRIHVYQPDYINFCATEQYLIATCHTLVGTGIEPLNGLKLSANEKSKLILRNFAELSSIMRIGENYYKKGIREAMGRGYLSSHWKLGSSSLWSAAGVEMLDIVARDVTNAEPGDLYFAHIPLPHSPYVYDRSCNLRNPRDWEDRREPLSRLHQYELYLEQIECTYNRLQDALDMWRRTKVFDRAKIIIQGDHGSRLYLSVPSVDNRAKMREADYVDAFSTLFAVKAPGLEPEYDRGIVAIQDALRAVVNNERLDGRAEGPFVLLPSEREEQQMMQWPMPYFGELASE